MDRSGRKKERKCSIQSNQAVGKIQCRKANPCGFFPKKGRRIFLLFTCSTVSIFQNLYLKHLGFDTELKCSECRSMDYELFSTEENGIIILQCKSCKHEEALQSDAE